MASLRGAWVTFGATALLLTVFAEELPIVERASFPEGFMFGTSGAAYQYEGAAHEGGKGLSIWDTYTRQPGKVADNSTGDVAVDQYHRYAEDIWLMKDINMDAYRFSISWPRIFPKGVGDVNWEGVRYYDILIDELMKFNIQPFVTIYHWDMPQYLQDTMGGWLNPDIIEPYTKFATFCFQRWGPKVKHWTTMNEIHIFAGFGYGNRGIMAPGRCSDRTACAAGNSDTEPYLVSHHALLAHALVVDIYRREFKGAQKGVIGLTEDTTWFYPLDPNSTEDQRAAREAQEGSLGWYFDPLVFGDYPASMRKALGDRLPTFTKEQSELLKGSFDYLAINHYSSSYATFRDGIPTKIAKINGQISLTPLRDGVEIGEPSGSFWLFDEPTGMRKILAWVRERYNNPTLYILENGVSETDTDEYMPLADQLKDTARIRYHHGYMQNLLLGIRDGSDVRGYFAWSLLDNFEWSGGFAERFGLYYVDYKNGLARYPKSSAMWFQKILKRTANNLLKSS